MFNQKLAGIQYHGVSGATQPCIAAIARLIQCGEWISMAQLLTSGNSHCFLLTIGESDRIAIKDGFSSGYSGEGPSGLASALQLFRVHGVAVEELEVTESFMQRIESSSLTEVDVDAVDSARPIRPTRWYDYIHNADGHSHDDALKYLFPAAVPYRLVDNRIADLARVLLSQPDSALMNAYRRLEERVRDRCKVGETNGARLFAKAFHGDGSLLYWPDIDSAEGIGRASLFAACFMAYRNRRAHKEIKHNAEDALREFLLLNELYLLEAAAIERPTVQEA